MKRIRLDREQAKLLESFLKRTTVVAWTPTEEQINARLQELLAFGLRDEPEFVGFSSSVRQYAINSLTAEAGHFGPLPLPFVTEHADLQRQSVVLEVRYGLRPVSPEEMMKDLPPLSGAPPAK